jgi:hypothetical protein
MGEHYRFERRWQVDAPLEAVYDVLVDLEHYPLWWPQVRAVASLGPDHALVVCRSMLPLTLHLELRPAVRDRERGRLQVSIDGDLAGWSRFTLTGLGEGVEVGYLQEVEARRRLLDAGRWARPLVTANHSWMMQAGEHGLARRLSARHDGRTAPSPS